MWHRPGAWVMFLEAKQVKTGKSPCSDSEWLQSSFADIGRHQQQAAEGHGIDYLLFSSASHGTDI
jgi:hypothetical protein